MKLEKLDATSVINVIDLVAVFTGESRRNVLEMVTPLRISASSLSKRKSFPDSFLADLEGFIITLPREARAAIAAYVTTITDAKQPTLNNDFAEWIDAKDVTSQDFVDRCANENGHYLIFRSPAERQLEIADMTINFDTQRNILPHFETTFYRGDDAFSIIKGQIFQMGSYVHAIGKVLNNPGMRFSKLRPYTRPNGCTDMYGIRLGKSQDGNLPYAHMIYCYQLRRRRSFSTVRKILSVTHPYDDDGNVVNLLSEEIDTIGEILRLIAPTGLKENGLVAEFFGA